MTDVDTGQILAGMLVGGELKIHLIGVAGSGMSGLAGLLLGLGHRVSGSDKVRTVEIDRLCGLGLRFHVGQDAVNIGEADLVIYSSAIRPGNVEYDEALRTRRNMARRADALAAIMHAKKGVVVCGMHGKTTTSAMAAHVLKAGGLHPSHYVGAEIPILGTNANWDPAGELFVVEGDESDGTLALYHPEHAIVLNIEEEHLDYYENLAAIEAVFQQVLAQTRGHLIYCADDANTARLCINHPGAISYGECHVAFYRFDNVHAKDFQSHFRVLRGGETLGAVTLNVPGRHNISNALGVVALASELGVPFRQIAEALECFLGARRRFEIKFRSDRYMIVDDYGHHPTEVKATLATARSTGRKRVLCMFQPHRYSRTQKLKEEFGRAFRQADVALIADVYPASESPIPGVTGQTIVEEMIRDGHDAASYQPDRKKIILEMGRLLEPGDCVVSLGAGNIHESASLLAMDVALLDELQTVMGPGVIKLYEPLAKHTTMRVGGPAQFWAEPETEEGFARLVRFTTMRELPLFVIGRGSNLLVRDGGIRGVVVHLERGEFRKIEVREGQIIAGVGVKQKELAYAARDAQIGGFEWFEGIPGNVGGALRMNAGAMGGETFRQVISVRFVDRNGDFHTRTPAEMEVHYRDVTTLRDNYAVSATFFGGPGTPEEIEKLLDASRQKRRSTQPRESSAGCIFKNPGTIPAGKLVDELGLKGTHRGNAKVSEIHGNFIVNEGGASASDVLALIGEVQTKAQRERGIALETEVQIIGEEKGLYD
ncbi:MAG TPA: UDP-N-acetylmuramate--L-alanine ligase [Chthoniobacteraceae bacterium]|jgi:UDP-N-acetylmuramate--L-alanine ligase/UDP-N-acetylenolpyruvoylglucosamine reductase|nr:UDP-N-acetylmuramate--L-alanine ligase [Chthoniobacteraceae bacterium]